MNEKVKAYLNARKPGKTEWIVLTVWVILVCIIRHFHEPWFDETQAWQIARYASIKDLLTVVEHYEGHPPFWHLLLMPFAKLGFPYKITIFCINLTFNLAALFLLLFRSPLPRWLKCYLPFNYYIFYQHGVHTRPYSLMMLAFFMAAIFYPERNKKPGRYIFSLMLLCFTCAYGMIIAGALCLLWTFEIFREYKANGQFARIPKDARFWWLVAILVTAILISIVIVPAPDVMNPFTEHDASKMLESLHLFLLIPFDATFGTILPNSSINGFDTGYIIGDVAGLLMWLLIVPLLKKNKKLSVFLLPYLMMTTFCVAVYFWGHHLEVYHMFFIFVLWLLYQEPIEMPEIYGKIMEKINSNFTKGLMKLVAAAALCVPLACTVASSVMDIKYRFGPMDIVNFVKNNHLENAKILTYWDTLNDAVGKGLEVSDLINDETLPFEYKYHITENNTTSMCDPVTVDVYFKDLQCFPYSDAVNGGKRYLWGRTQTPEEVQADFKKWQEIGLPDFVISSAPLQEAFPPEMLDGVTYYWIDDCHFGIIWKFNYEQGEDHVYIRGDLLDQYPQFHVKTYAEEAKKK